MRIARDQSTFQNQVVVAKFSFMKEASLHTYYPARARNARARMACALRALGLLLADGAPTVVGGKTF